MTDRGEYRSIHTVLLDGPDFQALTPAARLVLLTLRLTLGPAAIGCVPGLMAVLCERTGYAADALESALAELIAGRWIERERNVVWVIAGLAHEPNFSAADPKHRKAVQKHLGGLPRLAIVARFAAHYAEWMDGQAFEGLAPTQTDPFEGPSKALRTPFEAVVSSEEGVVSSEERGATTNYLPATPDGAPEGRTPGAALPAAPAPRLEPAAVAPTPAPAPLPALALVPLDLETPPAGTPAGTPAARQSAAPRSASPKGAAKATPKAPEKWPGFTKADCDTLFATWREFGEPNYGRFRNTFGPLFPESGPRYPVERVVKAIKEAIEEAKSKGGYDLRTLTPDTFVARVGYWVEQSSMPVVDDWGNPTARGIRYGMIA